MIKQPTFQTHDYTIGGKLVVCRAHMDERFAEALRSGDIDAKRNIKRSLTLQLAEFMLENDLLEFTHYTNPLDYSTQVAVRAYIAPNDQVKIIRSVNPL